MSRRDDTVDPGLAAELDQLEAAFRADVRATAARPALHFRARLDDRVRGGFPKPKRQIPLWLKWSPAVAAACATLVALVVAIGSTGDSSTSSMSSRGGATVDRDVAARGSSGAASSPRFVERTTALTLRVARGDVQDTADGVVRATQAAGGYVQSSNVSLGDRGEFQLRIPTRRLDAAVAALSRLGHVASLQQLTQDITSTVNSAAARLQDARAERRGLLRALGKATSPREIASLKARLRDNRRRLAGAELNAKVARSRVALSTVSVTVTGVRRGAVAPPKDDGPWSPGDALHDASRVLEVGAGVALIAVAVALLLAIPGGLAWFGARAVRRRRREAALDG